MLIGFTNNTRKIMPRIFCRKFRHCAIVLEHKAKGIRHRYTMIQVGSGKINFILLQTRDLKILEQNGWVFLEHKAQGKKYLCVMPYNLCSNITCVSFAKHVLKIRAPFIWTPDALYKYLTADKGTYSDFNS